MDHFAGLDVSVKETSICIVDDTGSYACALEPGTGAVPCGSRTGPAPCL
jgi:hypothetical protein